MLLKTEIGGFSMRLNFMSSIQVIHALRKDSQKKRVAGYARVSTADEHQDSSYRLQIQELEASIRLNPKYEFIGIFKDRKSGSSIKGRQEFTAMIDLALMGEIDVIITKSITRFARNILDTISIVRELKNNNIEVIFQKEGISTLDPSLEMILTVLAMHAEEEAKNISENTRWNFQRKMRAGGNFTTNLYGYKIKGEEWKIKNKEASVVRLIFDMYINQFSYREIIDKLYDLGVASPTGKNRWVMGGIEQMVQNEKYAGHMSLGKTYTLNGTAIRSQLIDLQDSMVMNHHKPIIEPEVFDKAIALRMSRSRNKAAGYIPFKDRITPFYQFVYSKTNDKYLKFVIERPKGKYEIPTLFAYDKNRENRVMVTVKNLFALLNNALGKLSMQSFQFASETSSLLNSKISECDELLSVDVENKLETLTRKVSLIAASKKLLSFSKQVKNYSLLHDVRDFKKLVRLVEIIDSTSFAIRLSLVEDNSLDTLVLQSSVNLKVGNLYRDVTFFIYL